MWELERKVPCVAFQKDPERRYHWSDPSRHLHVYSRQVAVCVTYFRVNQSNQSSGINSLFINSDLRSIYIYIYIYIHNYHILPYI